MTGRVEGNQDHVRSAEAVRSPAVALRAADDEAFISTYGVVRLDHCVRGRVAREHDTAFKNVIGNDHFSRLSALPVGIPPGRNQRSIARIKTGRNHMRLRGIGPDDHDASIVKVSKGDPVGLTGDAGPANRVLPKHRRRVQ